MSESKERSSRNKIERKDCRISLVLQFTTRGKCVDTGGELEGKINYRSFPDNF